MKLILEIWCWQELEGDTDCLWEADNLQSIVFQ